ncbi:GGDEF domain-containing response regulator [Colwellia piezophila]|uniref:GGDEF domain-containing response regulator n=1 Tax=Colwellia piezophila TaxID=211668 RepID=UPI000369ECED|nr:response regulator [Colwellia piezophila]
MLREKSILIVDDEEGVRQTLKRGIHRQFNKGCKRVSISEAGNGKEAIAIANNFPPDLILMDIRMPVMDGLKACQILRSDSKFASTMIIMLTCEITEESAGLLSGADDYIIKPFDIKTLLIRIERGLFKQGAMGPVSYAESDGVLSKNYFVESWLNYEIARAKRYQHPLSLLLVKIESINDKQGAKSRDLEVIKLLKRRASDPLIKWGEKTFAILLIETCAEDAVLLAKRIIWLVQKSPNLSPPNLGIANLEDTFTDDLIINAEYSLAASIASGNVVLNRLAVSL